MDDQEQPKRRRKRRRRRKQREPSEGERIEQGFRMIHASERGDDNYLGIYDDEEENPLSLDSDDL
jgi:hypothetical protein